jgi:hypothetical protein
LLAGLLAVGWLIGTRPGRLRGSLILALLLCLPLWGPMLLGGHLAFLVAGLGLLALARKRPTLWLREASLCLCVCGELYWGTLVMGSNWTAPVMSLTFLALCWLGIRRVVRSERALDWLAWTASLLLTALYVSTNLYKAYFLDFPSFAAFGSAGQVGQIVDSILSVFQFTHLLALLAPFVVLVSAKLPFSLAPERVKAAVAETAA